jgi:tetratricopeptide (TPR) repeat protein
MFTRVNGASTAARELLRMLFLGAVCAVALGALAAPCRAQTGPGGISRAPEIDAGFLLLYDLKPAEAREKFAAWRASHPKEPLADAAEAASYLFEECYRQDVLTSEFFLDDKRFLGKVALKPDPALRAAFFAAVRRAQELAETLLKADANDADALFAMTLSTGLEADYASLIDMDQRESLRKIREADTYAKRLLAVAPDAADAYLTLGVANYIIGSLPATKRFFLRFAGIRGDKHGGIRQLEIAAAQGRYLRPFAKILLALVALREKQPEMARRHLAELVEEFPQNPLFASELAKLGPGPVENAGFLP